MKMSSERFFRTYRPASCYGKTWYEFGRKVLSDPDWTRKIIELTDSIGEHGQLEPVVVSRGWLRKSVLNGNHRALVNYVTMGTEVEYIIGYPDSDDKGYYVSVIEGLDIHNDNFMSFPIPGGWMTADVSTCQNGLTRIYWNETPPGDIDDLIEERAVNLGINITATTTYEEDEE